jgi:hypothetical protein
VNKQNFADFKEIGDKIFQLSRSIFGARDIQPTSSLLHVFSVAPVSRNIDYSLMCHGIKD